MEQNEYRSDEVHIRGLIKQLDPDAKRRIFDCGIFVADPLGEFDAEVLPVVAFEHPDGMFGEEAELDCPICLRTYVGLHDENNERRQVWALDDGSQSGAPFCESCAVGLIDSTWLRGFTPYAVEQILKEIRDLEAQSKLSVELKECSFGEELVHFHRITATSSGKRMKELTGVEYYDAWLVASEFKMAILVPGVMLQDDDFDEEFLTNVAMNVRDDVDSATDCEAWINLTEKYGAGNFSVSRKLGGSYFSSLDTAIRDFVAIGNVEKPHAGVSWIQV